MPKYGMQQNIKNDLQQCINSFERMKNGGIGIADDMVLDTCKRALIRINQLEELACGSNSQGRILAHWILYSTAMQKCSLCGKDVARHTRPYNYCPGCGAWMVEKEVIAYEKFGGNQTVDRSKD